jgi:hypothetical protein
MTIGKRRQAAWTRKAKTTMGNPRMRHFATGLAVLCGAFLLNAAAATATTPSGGPVKFWITPSANGSGAIVITGAIGDYGTATTVNKSGLPNQNGNYSLIKLKDGTLEVKLTSFNEKNSKVRFPINQTSCSSEGTETGTVSLSDGTGRYKGITGDLGLSETNVWILGRSASGGKCTGTEVLYNVEVESGSGNVSF